MKFSFYLWNERVGSWELAEGGADPDLRFVTEFPCVDDDGRVWICWPDCRKFSEMPSGGEAFGYVC